MAITKFRAPEPASIDPFEPPLIPALADDAEYAAAIKLENALRSKLDRNRLEDERLTHQSHLANRPSGASDGPRDALMRKRLAELQKLPPYWGSESADPAALDISAPALARAIALLRGEPVSPELSLAERRARLECERQVLEDGLRFQAGVMEARRAELCYRLCQNLKAHHDAVLLATFRAYQAAAALTDVERAFRSAILVAGYEIRADIIPAPFISAPLLLGSEQRYDSQISAYRRFLQQRGVVS